VRRLGSILKENANMTSFRNLTGVAAVVALAAATPAYAVLNPNALVPNAFIKNALTAVGTAFDDLNRVAVDAPVVPDGVGGVLVIEEGKVFIP
jgi:hypothetical protein